MKADVKKNSDLHLENTIWTHQIHIFTPKKPLKTHSDENGFYGVFKHVLVAFF